MDYKGQALAENLFYWIILCFGAVGWVIGYVQQDFAVVFYAWLVGVVLSVIVSLEYENCVPFSILVMNLASQFAFPA